MRSRTCPAVLCTALALIAPAAVGAATTLPVIGSGQSVQLAGTNIHCFVITSKGSTYVDCLLERADGKTIVDGSYGFALGDRGVLVTHVVGGKTTTALSRPQQAIPAVAAHPAGKHTGALSMKLGAQLLVGGTHVLLAAAKNADNEPGFVAVIPNASGDPLSGTYLAGISSKRLVVSLWKGGKSTLVFSKTQP